MLRRVYGSRDTNQIAVGPDRKEGRSPQQMKG